MPNDPRIALSGFDIDIERSAELDLIDRWSL
jgi:hypothetical protein